MSDDVKPEPIKREEKHPRAAFSIAVMALFVLAAYEVINWLAHLRH